MAYRSMSSRAHLILFCVILALAGSVSYSFHYLWKDIHSVVKQILVLSYLTTVFTLAVYFLLFRFILPVLKQYPKAKQLILLFFSAAYGFLLIFTQPIGISSMPSFQRLEIVATGEKNAAASSSEVWVLDVTDAGRNTVPLSELSAGPEWDIRDGALLSYRSQPAGLFWQGEIKGDMMVTLLTHPWSGIAKIKWDNQEQFVDLFSSTGSQMQIRLPSPPASPWLKGLLFVSDGLSLFFLTLLMLCFLLQISEKLRCKEGNSTKRRKALLVFCFLLCVTSWLIFLAVCYPGIMTSDSTDQWNQMTTLQLVNHHPAFHTLTNWLITRVWFSPASVALAQILMLALVFTYAARTLEKLLIPTWLILTMACFFALNPINGVMVITLWKDIFFSTYVFLLTIILINIYSSEGKWLQSVYNQLFLVMTLAFVALYRHNGILISLGALFVLWAISRRQRLPILKALAGFLILLFLVEVPLYRYLQVAPMGKSFKLTTPIQQVARVIAEKDDSTFEDSDYLNSIFPIELWRYRYNRYFVRTIIFDEEFNHSIINSDLKEFIRVWWNVVKNDPLVIIKERLSMTNSLWQIREPNEWAGSDGFPVIAEENSSCRGILNSLFTSNRFSFFRRPALYNHLLLVCFVLLLIKGNSQRLLVFIPVAFNLLSLVPTLPAQDFRFAYCSFLVLPFIAGLLFGRDKFLEVRGGHP